MKIDQVIDIAIKKLAELSLDDKFIPSLEVYHKPNNFNQSCYICSRPLEKGELIEKEVVGATGAGYLRYTYAHLDCFLAMLFHTINKVDGDG